LRKGFNAAELSWVLKSNTQMMKLGEAIGGKPYKEYLIYEKPISS
jgi:hypothetical protein